MTRGTSIISLTSTPGPALPSIPFNYRISSTRVSTSTYHLPTVPSLKVGIVLYWTNEVDQEPGGRFVFANGDATGFGFHGDFLNGWNMGVLTNATRDCLYTDDGGVVSSCAALAPSNDIDFPRHCLPEPSIFGEKVHGLLGSLPGCNPVTLGPESVPQVVCDLNHTTIVRTDSVVASSVSLSTAGSTSTLVGNLLCTATATS